MRWSDMDAYQHINNVAFLGYFEMARVSLFFEHPTHDEKTGMRRGLVVHSHEITYKRSVVYDADPLEIQIWVSGIRAAAFPATTRRSTTGSSPSPASTCSCPFDFALNRPRRITPEEKDCAGQRATDDAGWPDGHRMPHARVGAARTRSPPSSTRTTAAS